MASNGRGAISFGNEANVSLNVSRGGEHRGSTTLCDLLGSGLHPTQTPPPHLIWSFPATSSTVQPEINASGYK